MVTPAVTLLGHVLIHRFAGWRYFGLVGRLNAEYVLRLTQL